MALADLGPDGSCVVIQADLRERDQCKLIPGASYSRTTDQWTAPLDWATCKVLRGVFHDQLGVQPGLMNWAYKEAERIQLLLNLRAQMEHGGDPDLFPFQRAGVAFLTLARHALLGDEMGSGKTVQTIRAVERLHYEGQMPFPMLVVCPNSMKLTWEMELKRWFRGSHKPAVFTLGGGAANRRKLIQQAVECVSDQVAPVVVIVNWEGVRLHTRLAAYGSVALKRCTKCGGLDGTVKETQCEVHLREFNSFVWGTVVADEAHRMQDPRAKQTRAVWAVSKDAEFRYALTGTPVADAMDRLWAIMHFVNPKAYPSKTRYIDRYALQSFNPFGGLDIVGIRPDTREEFFAILDPQFRRMPKSATLPFLPKKLRETRWVEMGTKQAKAYKQMKEHMVALLDEGLMTGTNPLTQMMRLVQFSSSYAEVDDAGNVKLTEPSNKLDELEDVLDDVSPEPVVVFAQSRQLIMLAAARMEKKGVSYRLLVGGMSDADRNQAMLDFQEGRARVMLATIAAGGVGITLTRSGIAVFLQRSWSMVDNKQAEDRVHRIGSEQHDKVLIIDLVSPGTVELGQIAQLEAKSDRLEEIVRDKELLKKLLEGGEVNAA